MKTRRQFLKTSAALATIPLLTPSTFAINKTQKPTVLIIGAGLSGLAAAYRLTQAGCTVTVLEARSRIGGRVFSHHITDDLVIELGAEWVGASHERIISLCEQFSLTLENNQFNTHLISSDRHSPHGQWDYSQKWKKTYDRILEQYSSYSQQDKERLDRLDWWRFLLNNGINENDLHLRELLDSTDFGESIRFVSAYAALAEYAESSEKNEMDYKIRGGNSLLAQKLADAIGPQHIKLHHTVTEVSQTTHNITLTCSGGATFSADYLICTAPTHTVLKIHWSPPLPEDTQLALNQLQYCRINKHAVLFSERFWQHEDFDLITDTCAHYFYHATKNQKSPNGVLISYATGDKADLIARQTDEHRKRLITDSLRPAFGDISPKILKHANYYWGNDPYSQGAYALYGRGQWFTLMPILKKPFLRTHFAGEHLADWQGFMEGAITTGEDAADAILQG